MLILLRSGEGALLQAYGEDQRYLQIPALSWEIYCQGNSCGVVSRPRLNSPWSRDADIL